VTTIRRLTPADEGAWRKLWAGYLDFYKEPDLPEAVTAATFQRLNGDSRFFAFVAEKDGALVGFVHCVTHPATWSQRDYCYLEDLFVSADARGAGAGRALIEAVYEEAAKRQCAKVYWLTQETNATARILYDNLASLSGFVHYQRKL
jgi:GNAT superfamily N-acetyltransferase